MALISLRDVSIGFRGPALLDEVTCQIEAGHKIGLLGRNGAGKTTFMRMLTGEVEADHGQITWAPGTQVALLPQDIPKELQGRIHDVVAAALPDEGPAHAWQHQHATEQILSRMELSPDAEFATLSSGMKRRVLLARALVTEPDVLLLDEPTNHLDIEAIDWLEGFLNRYSGTLIFVTHDRMFLRRLAQRILEVDRGHLFDWSCDYETFLERKEAALEAEEKQNALFDKKLAEEEVWIRQGIKARRTRNEGRVRALEAMRRERADRRETTGTVRLEIQSGQRSGNLVAEVEKLTFGYGQRPLVQNFSTRIMRGDKIGIVGPNGVGKTTLVRLLLGQLQPQSGKVRQGSNLQIAYFDQVRDQLDESKTVQENVGDGYDTIGIGGTTQHVIGYLKNFLFSPDRARTEVRYLSGGERNRILLAKLFAKPANVIVLDEPTNDLDTETLELLESRLVEFSGTILLVSHDREFLNNVVTSTIVFEPSGVREYVGGYDDWLRQRPETASEPPKKTDTAPKKSQPSKTAESSGKRKLKFKEKQELESLPATIEQLETRLGDLQQEMAKPNFYQQGGDKITAATAQLKELESQLATAYHRWEELEQFAE